MATETVNYKNLFSLEGKVALVTGGARGIGAEVARALVQCGAAVLITDILENLGQQTANDINASGGKAAFLKQDVTSESDWESAAKHAIVQFGSLDILVNNAGIEEAAMIKDYEVDAFRKLMDINVTGVFLGLKHAIRVMKPGSSIINLSSVAGLIGTSGHIAYHASKGAVRLMTKAAAVECAQLGTGIRVNSIHPAIVQTDMGTSFVRDFVDLKMMPDYATAEAAFKSAHPIGRFGAPSDIAGAVVYLASDATQWMTGSELVIDGGFTAA